jgi:hypothetical protein
LQTLAAQRIDLVEEQHQRARANLGPCAQPGEEELRLALPWPGRGRLQLRGKIHAGQGANDREHRALCLDIVVLGHFGGLATEMQGCVLALARDALGQGPQGRGLAGLARGMNHETHAALDQLGGIGQALGRGQHVVILRIARARGVEEAHAPNLCANGRYHNCGTG